MGRGHRAFTEHNVCYDKRTGVVEFRVWMWEVPRVFKRLGRCQSIGCCVFVRTALFGFTQVAKRRGRVNALDSSGELSDVVTDVVESLDSFYVVVAGEGEILLCLVEL